MDCSEPDRDVLRVMTYSHDGFGMGHLRRNATIATHLVESMPASSVLMLIGCPAGVVFRLPPGVDFVKIPSIVKVNTEVWHPRGLRISLEKTRTIRASIIQKAAETFSPHVLLVDHIPTGVWGELLPTLEMFQEREDPPRVVLGIRDILDSPEVIRRVWQQKRFYEVIRRYYDEVLVYGCWDVFDAASRYGLNAELAEKVKYCGYVSPQEPCKSREQMRQELQLTRDKLIVVTAGGGHDGYPMMQACAEAFRLLGKALPFEAVFITGPLMEAEQRARLRACAEGTGIRELRCVEDNLNYINAADLVVTMAGYNSLCEILRLGKKALVIPRAGPSAEQIMRSRIFAERRLIDVIYPGDLSPERLAERLIADLERDDYPVHDEAIELEGAGQAALRLTEFVSARTRNNGTQL